MTDLYESAIAGDFMYGFGYLDALEGFHADANLILNAQNTLDTLIGDLFGEVLAPSGARYFLIEFKQKLVGVAGFGSEWSKASKRSLLWHLLYDYDCLELSVVGHFGVWLSRNLLRAAPYICAVNGAHGKGGRWGTAWQLRRDLRAGILGLTSPEMADYLACMFAHHAAPQAQATALAFGKASAGGAVTIAMGTFSSLEDSLSRIGRLHRDMPRPRRP